MLEANASVSIPQAVWIACNHEISPFKGGKVYVSIPQAVWIACNDALGSGRPHTAEFQYRKRYGLHAICTPLRGSPARRVSIPQAVWIACNLFAVFMRKIVTNQFQYRKRYGLHAMFAILSFISIIIGFQYRKRYGLHAIAERIWVQQCVHVSIPQAVWIACNVIRNHSKKG